MILDQLIADHGGKAPVPPTSPFNPARWPYTYDYFRQCFRQPMGRAEAAGTIKMWCDENGANRDIVVYGLAYRYLEYWNITK